MDGTPMIALVLALAIVGTPHRTVVETQYGPAVAIVVSVTLDATGVCYEWGLSGTCYTTSTPYCIQRGDRRDCVLPHHARNNPTPVPERSQLKARATASPLESPTVYESALTCADVGPNFSGCPCDVILTPSGSCFPPPP